jgi:hypothetical protein
MNSASAPNKIVILTLTLSETKRKGKDLFSLTQHDAQA